MSLIASANFYPTPAGGTTMPGRVNINIAAVAILCSQPTGVAVTLDIIQCNAGNPNGAPVGAVGRPMVPDTSNPLRFTYSSTTAENVEAGSVLYAVIKA